jgi:hypothetical protein
VYAIASHARDADECRELLAMAGVDLDIVRDIRSDDDQVA